MFVFGAMNLEARLCGFITKNLSELLNETKKPMFYRVKHGQILFQGTFLLLYKHFSSDAFICSKLNKVHARI